MNETHLVLAVVASFSPSTTLDDFPVEDLLYTRRWVNLELKSGKPTYTVVAGGFCLAST